MSLYLIQSAEVERLKASVVLAHALQAYPVQIKRQAYLYALDVSRRIGSAWGAVDAGIQRARELQEKGGSTPLGGDVPVQTGGGSIPR